MQQEIRASLAIASLGGFMLGMLVAIQQPAQGQTFSISDYQTRVERLKPESHVWTATKWRTSLSEGLADSIKTGKPVLLWTFIHNPLEERC